MSFSTYDGKIVESKYQAECYNKKAFATWMETNPKITYEQAVNSGKAEMFKEVAWELFTSGEIGVDHWMEDCGLDMFLETLETDTEEGSRSERDRTRDSLKLLHQYMKQSRLSIVEGKVETKLEPKPKPTKIMGRGRR